MTLSEKIHFDSDPDGLSGKALPVWLTTLINKYTAKVPPVGPQIYTVGKLAAFVSVVVVNRLACSPEEIDAINEVWLLSCSTVLLVITSLIVCVQ